MSDLALTIRQGTQPHDAATSAIGETITIQPPNQSAASYLESRGTPERPLQYERLRVTRTSGFAAFPGSVTWEEMFDHLVGPSAYRFTVSSPHTYGGVEVSAELLTVAADILKDAASVASDDGFEDGVPNRFYEELLDFVHDHGAPAVHALAQTMTRQSEEVQEWLLRYLAEVQTPDSNNERFDLIRKALQSPSPNLRHAAAMALATMGARAAIPDLKNAIERERWQGVRKGMESALRFLTSLA